MGEQIQEAREEQARRELGHTAVRPSVALALSVAFGLTLGGVASFEIVRDARAGSRSPWPELAQACTRAWRAVSRGRLSSGNGGLHAGMTTFEGALEERSAVAERARPWFQAALTRWLRTGNEQVVVGRSGWLYFRPALDYLSGRGFLKGGHTRASAPSGRTGQIAREPDPLPALADFAAQLAERGIGLVVVPTPVKAALHPEGLVRARGERTLPIENPSFDEFLARLDALEIPAYAPAARLARRGDAAPLFLRTDTHWTPAAMEDAAAGLAEFLGRRPLPEGRGAAYTRRGVGVAGRGDLGVLLPAPMSRPLFRPERAVVQRVTTHEGQPWQPDPAADVLLLGDSFTNIYSQAELGWGDSAGFAEQLSYFLGRPIDRIAVNAGGPSAARERLAARLAAGDDRLAGKRLVVYQFSARELAAGDWRLVDLTPASQRKAARRLEEPLPARGVVVWESNRGGDWRVWTRRLEGSSPRRLTPDEPGRQHCCPHLSPDGSQLAYLSRTVSGDEYPADDATGELRLLRLAGGGERVVVDSARPYGWGNRAVVWRNDRELVYVGADGRTFLLDLVSGRSSQLTDEPRRKLAWLLDASLRHAVNGSPTFSTYDAASRRVIEGSRRAGCEPYFTHDGRAGFWVEGAGGPIRRIDLANGAIGTLLDRDDRRIAGAQRYAYFPMVSRDGRMLVYGASAGDHDHFRSNYDVFAAPIDPVSLELLGRPQRLSAHPASDRYPDVHVEALDLERWKREAPAAPVPGAPPAPPRPPAGIVEARGVLQSCSRVPSLREISPYRSALIVCEWGLSEVFAGTPVGTRLRVAHWGLRDGERQALVAAGPGLRARLRVEPFSGAEQVEGYPVFDTLPREPGSTVYYAREP